MTLTPTFLPWSVSLQPLSKQRVCVMLKGQWQSFKGQSDEGLASTLKDWRHFQRSRAFRHAREQQSLRLLLDSIRKRIQQQKTRQMWNFPHPERLHPVTVSFLVYLCILVRLSQNSSCSAARCHFSSLCSSIQRGSLGSWRAWKSISWGFNLLHIQSPWAPCDQHYGSVLRLKLSSTSLFGYSHLQKWAGQVL